MVLVYKKLVVRNVILLQVTNLISVLCEIVCFPVVNLLLNQKIYQKKLQKVKLSTQTLETVKNNFSENENKTKFIQTLKNNTKQL